MKETFADLLADSKSQVHFEDGTSVTASELAERGAQLAGALGEFLEPEDRIAIWLPSGRTYLELIAACAAGGFAAVNVNVRYSPREAAELIERSGARVVIANQTVAPTPRLRVFSADQIDALTAVATAHPGSGDDPFLVFTTSGTTSKPKMVLHTQRSVVHHSHRVCKLFGLGPETPALVALPMCGVFGLNSFASAIAADCPIWVMANFDAERASRLVAEHQIVAMNGSDDMFHRMLTTSADLSTLSIAGFGAFNASLDGLAVTAEASGVKLSGLYGMSEVQALFSLRNQSLPVSERQRPGGRPASPDYQVRVVNPDTGQPLDHGGEGELQIRGPSLFAGYLNEGGGSIDEVLTVAAFDGNWFRTGDLGATSPDGSFRFITRMGDVLRIGGFLVAPAEIEEVMLGFPGIQDVQVVAASSDKGVRPVAFVIATTAVDEGAVIGFCQQHLAKFKCPVRVLKITEFPTTDGPNGVKVQKSTLREMAVAALKETNAGTT